MGVFNFETALQRPENVFATLRRDRKHVL